MTDRNELVARLLDGFPTSQGFSGYYPDVTKAVALMAEAAARIEQDAATIARLEGERDALRDYIDRYSYADIAAEVARAEAAEARVKELEGQAIDRGDYRPRMCLFRRRAEGKTTLSTGCGSCFKTNDEIHKTGCPYGTPSAAEAKLARADKVINAYNDLLRSAAQIAKREGIEERIASTNWDAYYNRLTVCLNRYHADWLASKQRLDAKLSEGPA